MNVTTPPATNGATAGAASVAATGAPTPDTAHPDTVRLALDWTPNTDHTGFYVAQAKGMYRDAATITQPRSIRRRPGWDVAGTVRSRAK